MKTPQSLYYMLLLWSISVLNLCCERQDDWLELKRNKNDVTPVSLQDFQAMLDNNNVVNYGYPTIGLSGTDNLFVSGQNLGLASLTEQNAYIWAKDVFQGEFAGSFSMPYVKIVCANVVLEGLAKLANKQDKQYQNIQGQALFLRGYSFYCLAQLFCKPYPASGANDLGLQLKLDTAPESRVQRSDLGKTYQQILTDLKAAAGLLPETAFYSTRPSRLAAQAALAKVYLSMEDYAHAGLYADSVIAAKKQLLDFNKSFIDPASTFIFPAYANAGLNTEILFYAEGVNQPTTSPVYGIQHVDSVLYGSYLRDDLRKTRFFKENKDGTASFTGSYSGTYSPFCGLALNEVYLISAECDARSGKDDKAQQTLNELLKNRFVSGRFTPLVTADNQQLLRTILLERRKELPFLGNTRWEDLRRLNKDPRFAKTLVHYARGIRYVLAPGDKRYTLPIPQEEIDLSAVPQNDR